MIDPSTFVRKVYLDETAAGSKVAAGKEIAAGKEAAAGSETAAGSPENHPEHSPSKLLRNVKGIIFDFDGTLFDNRLVPFYLISAYPPDILRTWRERLVRKRFTGRDFYSPEKYFRAFFSAMAKACSSSPERMRSWYFNRYMPRMTRVLKKYYKPRPGAIDLLRQFDADRDSTSSLTLPAVTRIAVYSDYPFLKERMEVLGIIPGQRCLLYGPDTFGAQKPAVRPFLSIAGDLGAKPEEILVIGDRESTDGLGAFKAGMRFFCLETGRKRYFKLDPYRRPPKKDGKAQGPSLVMYAGSWDNLIKLLMGKQ